MNRWSTIKEIYGFIVARKKWWLTPIIILLLMLGAIMVITQGSSVTPFLYAIF